MTEGEIARAGAEFKARVREAFRFLVEEMGFEPAVDESDRYLHSLTFRNARTDQLVEILNAFHGYDYGFEVTLHRASGPRERDGRNLIYSRLKEEQEPGFSFLAEAAQRLRAALR